MGNTNYKCMLRCRTSGKRERSATPPLLLVWLLLIVFPGTGACESKRTQPDAAGQKLLVVTTVAPITSMVENVAGDTARVTGIIPEGMNSHTFEPVPSDTRLLAEADLIIMSGLDLEIPTLRLARANSKKGARILQLGNETLTGTDYVFDFSFPREQGHPNPHLWLDPIYAMSYTKLVRDALSRLAPQHRDVYEQNAAAYLRRLEALDRAITDAVATIPEPNRRLLTYHDSWPYFARRYGFQVIGAVQPSDFSDPSPREVARLIDQIRSERVPAVFGSEVFPSPVLEQIAKESQTRYIDKLRDDELPGTSGDYRHSYIGMMLYNIRIMVEALGGSAKALEGVDPTPVAGAHADYRARG